MKPLLLVLIIELFSNQRAYSDTSKRGKPVCILNDCNLRELPISIEKRELNDGLNPVPITPLKTSRTPKRIKTIPKRIPTVLTATTERAALLPSDELISNLPGFYEGIDRSDFASSNEGVFDVASVVGAKLTGLKSGDIIRAAVEQSIKASPSVDTPIRAMILSGPYKGGFLLGRAFLEPELKRVLLEFVKLRLPGRDQVFRLKASGLSLVGQVGLEGRYEHHAGIFFVGEVATAAVAGFADASTQRSLNLAGNYVQAPTIANSAKQGAVSALSKTAERFADKARSAPEFTEINPYQEIQIIIEEDPTEIVT